MDHGTIIRLIPAYALGATDAHETLAVESHLPDCQDCRALLVDYRNLAEGLAHSTPPVYAPLGITERMRARLEPATASVGHGSWWSWLRRGWLAPALAVAVLLLVLTNTYWMGHSRMLEGRSAQQAAAFAGLANGRAVALSAEAPARYAQGVIYKSGDGDTALLCVYGMPTLEEGKTYQLWLIRNGVRESGGLFTVSADGFGLLVLQHGRPLSDYSGAGVTVEPAGGSPAPTSPRLIGGNL